jgi:hypothetical protein
VGLNMLEREVGLTGKKPEQSAPVPAANAAWVETQTMVDQPEGDNDVLAEVCPSLENP